MPGRSRISAGRLASGQAAAPARRARRTRSRGRARDASTITFGSTAAAAATASGNCAQSVTLVMPMLDPARAGFTNTGRPSRSRAASSSTAGSAQTAPVGVPQHDVVALRQPGGGEQLLGELLVHRGRAGEHARTRRRAARPSPAGPGSCRPRRRRRAARGRRRRPRSARRRSRRPARGRRARARPGRRPGTTAVPPATSGSAPSVIASRWPGSASTQPPVGA